MKGKLWAVLLILSMLCGCASRVPPASTFDPAAVQEATEEVTTPQRIVHTEKFQNANGSVAFNVQLDTQLSMAPMAVIEAAPRKLTAEDAKEIIYAFFPDAQCYERHPGYTSPETYWTKAVLEKNMQRWRSYSYEDLVAIYGGEDNLPGVMDEKGKDIPYMQYWQDSLQYFEELLEKAPDTDMRTPSLWQMFKETEYWVEPEEAARMDLSDDRDCIQASVVVGEHHYSYVVVAGNPPGDFRNVISLSYNTQSSPSSVDWQIFLSENKALPPAGQEDLDKARAVAQRYLDKFLIGDWVLDRAMPSDSDGTIYVSARPESGILQEGTQALLDITDFQQPKINFRIHPDGRLLGFHMNGNLTQTTVHAQNALELPIETLLRTALNQLKSQKTMAYGISEENLCRMQIEKGEDVQGNVDVTQMLRGYACLETQDGGLCYVPCVVLMGSVSYAGIETGTHYTQFEFSYLPEGEIPLAAVNAIDGTVIPIPL